MYVYIREKGTIRFKIFGPATYGECQAWMKLKKINPREVQTSCDKLLSETCTSEKTLQIE